jgi:transcription elongation factor GreA
MPAQRPVISSRKVAPSGPPPVDPECSLTRAEHHALVRELDELRSTHRAELARQLRDARAFGSPADNDDVFAVLEEVSVDRARIARLEELVSTAAIVDAAIDGRVGLGCTVRVADEAGKPTSTR